MVDFSSVINVSDSLRDSVTTMKYLLLVPLSLLFVSSFVGCAGSTTLDGVGGIPAPTGDDAESVYEQQDKAIRQLGY